MYKFVFCTVVPIVFYLLHLTLLYFYGLRKGCKRAQAYIYGRNGSGVSLKSSKLAPPDGYAGEINESIFVALKKVGRISYRSQTALDHTNKAVKNRNWFSTAVRGPITRLQVWAGFMKVGLFGEGF